MVWMKNKKLIFTLTFILLLSLLLGCSGSTSEAAVGKHKIVRETVLNDRWQMYQLEFTLKADEEFDVLLTLADGDTVDGYFYPEKDNGLVFRITADGTVIYGPETTAAAGSTTSDRFSFTATQAQGSTYIINLKNTVADSSTITFVELIYPVTGSIYIPLEAQ
jgi:hypothetical protein